MMSCVRNTVAHPRLTTYGEEKFITLMLGYATHFKFNKYPVDEESCKEDPVDE